MPYIIINDSQRTCRMNLQMSVLHNTLVAGNWLRKKLDETARTTFWDSEAALQRLQQQQQQQQQHEQLATVNHKIGKWNERASVSRRRTAPIANSIER